MLQLDHIAVAGETLAEAVAHSEAALGIPLGPGGQHAYYATHNQLVGLADGLYFEAIAIDPSQPEPAHPRWFGLDRFKGPARLDKWILRCADIGAVLEVFPDLGEPVHLTRGDVSWTMIVPQDGMLPFDGLFPAIIQWHTDTPPGQALPATEVRLKTLRVETPDADALHDALAPVFADARVEMITATNPRLTAIFDTPQGERVLR
ncbi:VOC family protein [Marivita hallyeonensis]|uniref:Glyoxalase-like domain-containing protein n=1 Tax=Marivita hallyeonensis TaxID=996342 RepID=A0A1M5RRB1_9RHOB|nr:VOC family protein [Marivita hallyeonensis]SHH28805.1 Glyoxalase-like domain-containing protein [Marivita hallyeonensis]